MGGGNFQKIEIGPLREKEEKSYYLYNLSSAHFVVYTRKSKFWVTEPDRHNITMIDSTESNTRTLKLKWVESCTKCAVT